jgi:hypothetical protein
MEVIIGLGLLWLVVGIFLLGRSGSKGSKPQGSGPIISRGNGIESHYDFLEMHGFITPEERQAQRDLEEDYKNNPHKYKVVSLQELMDEINKKKKDN